MRDLPQSIYCVDAKELLSESERTLLLWAIATGAETPTTLKKIYII
jgi:hypothetical protein